MPQVSVRDRLLLSAIDLMRRRGVAGSGVSDLLEASGVARRSLYLNFPGGKDELVAEATGVAGRFISSALRAEGSSADLLATLVRMWRDVLVESEFQAGCPVAAAALAGESTPSAPAAAAAAFGAWRTKLATRLEADGLTAADAEDLAEVAIAAIEGAVLLAIADRSTRALDRVQAHLLATLEARLA